MRKATMNGRLPEAVRHTVAAPGDDADPRCDSEVASLGNTAAETVAALREAHDVARQIDARLFGESPCGVGDDKFDGPPSLADLIEEGRGSAGGLAKRLHAVLDRL